MWHGPCDENSSCCSVMLMKITTNRKKCAGCEHGACYSFADSFGYMCSEREHTAFIEGC